MKSHDDKHPEAIPEHSPQPAAQPQHQDPASVKPALSLEERVAKLEAWIPRLEAIVGAP